MITTELVRYIVDNLSISIDTHTRFGPRDVIKVELLLGENVISESECEIETEPDV